MTKGELIEAMADFPDDIPVSIAIGSYEDELTKVTEICPTGTDTTENYLLLT